MANETTLQDMAHIMRRDSLNMTAAAGSGHPTTCMSCAEIMSVLFFHEMHYDTKNPHNPDSDEFVLSKGHAAPILYSALKHAGCIKHDLMTLRQIDSPLEGHPVPASLDWIKVATGSLGQGLSCAVGMALAARMQGREFRTYCVLGDSECAEGSVFEALALASHNHLDNLCIIVDVNRLGQRGQTMQGHDLKTYKARMQAFGAHAVVVNGHDCNALKKALAQARETRLKPTVILAKTYKGHGVSFLKDKDGFHGKPVKGEDLEKALKEIPQPSKPPLHISKPRKLKARKAKQSNATLKLNYKKEDVVASRQAYGKALAKLAAQDGTVCAVDAEVSNSTFANGIQESAPERFVEAYIAEQNMVGVGLGLAVKGMNVFASSFAAFLTRAHDQIRMAALSSANMTFAGSHCGVSIGEDGGSQMGLEDLAMFRSMPGSTVFYPGDAVSGERLTQLAGQTKGVSYVRTSRPKTEQLYSNSEKFPAGGFKVHGKKTGSKCLVVGAGVTLHEALKAQAELKKAKKDVTVVDCYSIKPFNAKKFIELAKKNGKKVVVVEDHYPEGGIGEMLAAACSGSGLQFTSLAVRKMPRSGKPHELLKMMGIDAKGIVKAVKKL